MKLQHYTSQDLEVRTAVAACAIGCTAAKLSKKLRYGSLTYCEQKNLEIAVNQMNCIRTFEVLALPAYGTITVTGDGGTDVPSKILVNGVIVSTEFLYSTDNNTTAAQIASAINSLDSSPNYTATSVQNVVTITAVDKGASQNNLTITQDGGDVNVSTTFMTSGQDGVEPEDNNITEYELEAMFNNISEFTGCCYAPLGYGYEPESDPNRLGIILKLNTGIDVTLNAGPEVRLNKKI
jgi:hypothetical protein